jgi:hypothetical protein
VDTHHPNTLLWLIESVFPCMRKLEKEGTIADLVWFVEHYLFQVPDSAQVQAELDDPVHGAQVAAELGLLGPSGPATI